jgi:hypothetical protein
MDALHAPHTHVYTFDMTSSFLKFAQQLPPIGTNESKTQICSVIVVYMFTTRYPIHLVTAC